MRRPDFRAVPPAPRGLRVGLFGGSFDPAHAGHAAVAKAARAQLGLDRVWWLVTPQNPLKPWAASPLPERMRSARAAARGPHMVVTDLETRLGLRFSADTVGALRKRRPGACFLWIMGADSLAGLHRWRRWRAFAAALPLAIAPRPKAGPRARLAPAAKALRLVRPRALERGGAMALLSMRLRPERSTDLRRPSKP